ncbi:phosphatase PAP2 family protein, partial [Piscirickettsia litoralis]
MKIYGSSTGKFFKKKQELFFLCRVILSRIYHFFDKLSLLFSFIVILLSVVVSTINEHYSHYTSLVTPDLLTNLFVIALCIILVTLSVPIRENYPKISLMFKLIGLYVIAWVVMFSAYNLQFTPFSPIDHFLYQADLAIGVQQNQWVAWLYHHPILHKIFVNIYNSLDYQVLILPILACFLINKQDVESFLVKLPFLQLIGGLIYYFWPTASPASLLNQQFLVQGQIDLALQFQQIHEGMMPTVVGEGLISFPSFHVIWSALFTLLFKQNKYLFIPLLILNVLLWVSTVVLGWHYMMDVIASLVLVGVAVF